MQNHFGLLVTDVMPIFMIIALDIIITMRFSINCSVVICSPTVIHAILREATSETYGPGVYFTYKFPTYNFSLLFISQSLFSIILIFQHLAIFIAFYFTMHLYYKNTKNIILLYLSYLTFVSDCEGIDNPFIALAARFLIVCAGTR